MSDVIEQLCNFIDGRWEEAPDRMPAINPATGAQIAWLPKSDRDCARKGIAAAKRVLKFAEAIPAGIVNINEGATYWEIHLPFGGGVGTKSGVGRLGGRFTLEAMTRSR